MIKNDHHFNENFQLCISKVANPQGGYMFGVEAKKDFNPARYDVSKQANIVAGLIPGKLVKGPLTADQLKVDRIQYLKSEDLWILRTRSAFEKMRDEWIKELGPFVANQKIQFPPSHINGKALTAEEIEMWLSCTIWYMNCNLLTSQNYLKFIQRKAYDNTLRSPFVGINLKLRWARGYEMLILYGDSYGEEIRRFNFIENRDISKIRELNSPMYCENLDMDDEEYQKTYGHHVRLTAIIKAIRRDARIALEEQQDVVDNFYPCTTVHEMMEEEIHEEGKLKIYNIVK